jgi:hypothetical protein
LRIHSQKRITNLLTYEPHLHAMTFSAGWNLAIGWKQGQLAVPPP